MYDIIVVGGGLAGLVSSILLSKAGKKVLLIEKKHYPFHRVCGEYISNETRPFLQQLGLDFNQLDTKDITRFQFTSPSGKVLETTLDLGGFGISRYTFDEALYHLAQQNNVHCLLNKNVENIDFHHDQFTVSTSNQTFEARYVIGSFGKRTKLDATLNRSFFSKRSPYIGVKYHIKTDFPQDLIALHNFKDGYCGISAIENDKYCLCYLTTRENLKKYGAIPEMEKNILWKNPHLRKIFTTSVFLYDKPEVINEISFTPKTTIENHILMVGDSAGLITPLCGNGMAMAIHGAKILSENILQHFDDRTLLEQNYQKAWKKTFAQRLWVGRTVQQLFGNEVLSEIALLSLKNFKFALKAIIKSTHGDEF
ncbi:MULTISPECIES: NAD(P)/FAD-dependent oxidoreductase [unclassified Arcicella]|uniref:NAD(P)/FAD-dependent oxidoreductase n=1 Tax=unclassified Arcicella TaxID=2644986 RepID=UPI00286148F4|nr:MULTISPECIES: NAD(P)/FAD-dependent oxidoreductase [unclassified Arcicella]MDR6563216.1 flavin-dependent dehydrogenase [Arcicella sp. BE51]MDR6811633.1 flavin-dependent dehydrogenase [Arcicella sp. BE140]MDR6823159.1 flavin-dependent dehydrogenase [Arcicella sp. BE139]